MADRVATVKVELAGVQPVVRLAVAAQELRHMLAEDIGTAAEQRPDGSIRRTLRPGTVTALVELQAALRAVSDG